MSNPWFRFYSETLRDRKVERCARVTETPKALVVGVWATILSLANDSPEPGSLLLTDEIPLTITDLEIETGLQNGQLSILLEQFLALQMLALDDGVYHIINWGKRQFKSDNSTARVRKYRRKQVSNVTETLQKSFSNAPDTDTDTEQIQSTEKDDGAGAPPAQETFIEQSERKPDGRAHFLALATLCKYDLGVATRAQKAQCGQSAKLLKKNGVTPEHITQFGAWWYRSDWRGKKGQPPTPAQVREEWGKFVEAAPLVGAVKEGDYIDPSEFFGGGA